MPGKNPYKTFFFKGLNKQDEIVRGKVQATSVRKAIAAIHGKGLRSSSVRRGNQGFRITCFKTNALCESSKMPVGFCDGCGG